MNTRLVRGLAAGSLLALAGAPGAEAQLVTNGDFEANGAAFVDIPGYVGVGGNPASITGWFHDPANPHVGLNPGSSAGSGFANNGDNSTQVAFLQTFDEGTLFSPAMLVQSITGFTPGQEYRLTFDYNARGGGYDLPVMTVFLDATALVGPTQVTPVGGSNPYHHSDLKFTAGNSTLTLIFHSVSSDAARDATLLIDNVSIVAVPEPGAAGAAMAVGLAALVALRRSRQGLC